MSRGKRPSPLTPATRTSLGMPDLDQMQDVWRRAHRVPTNAEIQDLLKQADGVEIWNSWRRRASVRPGLAEFEINGLVLDSANIGSGNLMDKQKDGLDLSNLRLTNFQARGVSMYQVNFENTIINKTMFDQCQLVGASFAATEIRETEFQNCNLSFSLINQNIWTAVKLRNSSFMTAGFIYPIFDSIDFTNCDLRESTFRSGEIEESKFEDCNWGVIGSPGEVREFAPMNWQNVLVTYKCKTKELPPWLQKKLS